MHMNSYNYNNKKNNNNKNRNRMPAYSFSVDDNLQDMHMNNNYSNRWNNGSNDDYYPNDNYSQNDISGLTPWEFKRYQRLVNRGMPNHKALSKCKFNPLLSNDAVKRKPELESETSSKRPKLNIQTNYTAISNVPNAKDKPFSNNHQNSLPEHKKNRRSFPIRPKITTEKKNNNSNIQNTESSMANTSNLNEKEQITEPAKKTNFTKKQNNSIIRSQKPKTAKNNNNPTTTASTTSNKSSKQNSTIVKLNSNKESLTKSTSTSGSNIESINNSNCCNCNCKNASITSNAQTMTAPTARPTTEKTSTTSTTSATTSKTNENTNNSNNNTTSATETETNPHENTSSASKEQENNNEITKDNLIRIGIMAKGFPNVVLDQNELEQLEESLVQAMSEGWTTKLRFDGIIYRPGIFLIECCNHKTASWLTLIINNLPNWRGPALEARFGYDTPDLKVITIYFPKAGYRTDDFLLKLLAAQNECLYVKLWTVFCSITQGQGKLITLGVDDMSFESIKNCDFLLRYRFGKIMVHTQMLSENILSDQQEAAENPANYSLSEDFELNEDDLNGIEECFYNIKTEKPD